LNAGLFVCAMLFAPRRFPAKRLPLFKHCSMAAQRSNREKRPHFPDLLTGYLDTAARGIIQG
jgi:hypothetical protein